MSIIFCKTTPPALGSGSQVDRLGRRTWFNRVVVEGTAHSYTATCFVWGGLQRNMQIIKLYQIDITLPETNSSPLKIGHPKRKLVFQPSIFGSYVSFREGRVDFFHQKKQMLRRATFFLGLQTERCVFFLGGRSHWGAKMPREPTTRDSRWIPEIPSWGFGSQ